MKKLDERTVFEGKWLKVEEIDFKNKSDNRFTWERIQRKNLHTIVVIVAKTLHSDELILIKQFRPAVENYVLGFPAGFCSDGDIKNTAISELKEETGYSGVVTDKSIPVLNAPGISGDQTIIVYMDVDDSLNENKNPVQDLEIEEDIEVIMIKKDSLKDFLIESAEKNILCGAGLWHFAKNIN